MHDSLMDRGDESELSKADEEAAWLEYKQASSDPAQQQQKAKQKADGAAEQKPPMINVAEELRDGECATKGSKLAPQTPSLFPVFAKGMSTTAKPKKKKKKRKRDPNQPKRAKSGRFLPPLSSLLGPIRLHRTAGYIFFCNDIRERVKAANMDKKPKELMGIMGKEWQEADDNTKKVLGHHYLY